MCRAAAADAAVKKCECVLSSSRVSGLLSQLIDASSGKIEAVIWPNFVKILITHFLPAPPCYPSYCIGRLKEEKTFSQMKKTLGDPRLIDGETNLQYNLDITVALPCCILMRKCEKFPNQISFQGFTEPPCGHVGECSDLKQLTRRDLLTHRFRCLFLCTCEISVTRPFI